MDWLSETTVEGAGEAVLTQGSVDRNPSRVGLVVGVGLLVIVAVAGLFGGLNDDVEQAATTTTSQADERDSSTVVTVRETAATIVTTRRMPDRGAFREVFVAGLVASCEHLVDGPEPIAAGLYREHGRCLNLALAGVDERCRLAADLFYVMPGDEALDIACDIQGEKSPDFRASVRESMVLQCDVARSARTEQAHEAYYEYDRCLQQIEPQLDETCYLVARAQFLEQIETVLREACNIDSETDLSAISG